MRRFLCSTTALFLGLAAIPTVAMAQTTQPAQQVQQQPAQTTGSQAVTTPRQQSQSGGAEQGQQQIAEACLQDLNAFAQRMDEDRFWITGWGTAWGFGSGTAATGITPGAAPAGTAAPAAGTAPVGAHPWAAAGGPFYGARSPRNQIEVLYGAAYVLAQQGKQDGCEYVLAQLVETYDQYTTRLQEAGIDPTEVTTWRQEQIALAQPVQQAQGMARVTIDDITGTDVRNLQDEHLGSVSDVVLDPQTGAITYAIVARGGFLGIGQDHIAVPWNHLRATPGLNTLVLNATEEAMENAPTVDPDDFGDPTTVSQQNQQVDQYWGQQQGG